MLSTLGYFVKVFYWSLGNTPKGEKVEEDMDKLGKRRARLITMTTEQLISKVERYALSRTIERHIYMTLDELEHAMHHWALAKKYAKTREDACECLALLILVKKILHKNYGILRF